MSVMFAWGRKISLGALGHIEAARWLCFKVISIEVVWFYADVIGCYVL